MVAGFMSFCKARVFEMIVETSDASLSRWLFRWQSTGMSDFGSLCQSMEVVSRWQSSVYCSRCTSTADVPLVKERVRSVTRGT